MGYNSDVPASGPKWAEQLNLLALAGGCILTGPRVHIRAKQTSHKGVFETPSVRHLSLCLGWYKSVPELSSHYLQTNGFHIFNYYTELFYVLGEKK